MSALVPILLAYKMHHGVHEYEWRPVEAPEINSLIGDAVCT